MTSITRTLTLSLTVVATLIFLVALSIVIWLDLTSGPMAKCEAAVGILARASQIGANGAFSIRRIDELVALEKRSPELWYLASADDATVENDPALRPKLPFTLPYTGPMGRSIIVAADQKRSFCLDVRKLGDAQLVVMVDGAHVAFFAFALNFIFLHWDIVSLIACGFLATVAAGSMLSGQFVARSIERVTRRALAIEPNAPGASMPLAGVPIELVPLVSALNKAFKEIDAYMLRQRRFLGNAAHELRTPLTLLRGKIESVADSSLRTELIGDVRRLSSLVAAMLDLARLKDDAIQKRSVNLRALTLEVLADFTPLALDKGIELSLDEAERGIGFVDGVETALRSALSNIIGNALIHAKGATYIVAEIRRASITIHDDGAGLPENHGEDMIEPFQKGEASRDGTGLGLSIVREIMIAHGGSLSLMSSPGSGTTIKLQFREEDLPAFAD